MLVSGFLNVVNGRGWGDSQGQDQLSVRVMTGGSGLSGIVQAAGLCPLLSQSLKQAADHGLSPGHSPNLFVRRVFWESEAHLALNRLFMQPSVPTALGTKVK